MKIAYLNLCHTDPALVARAAARLTEDPDADMYIHVDLKSDIAPFEAAISASGLDRVRFIKNRVKVYWGGFNAVIATLRLLDTAVRSGKHYDRYVILQNLDYPLKSWREIHDFFEKTRDIEFIRACRIAESRDWHFAEKYKIIEKFDDDFYLSSHSRTEKLWHNGLKFARSIPHLGFNGIIHDGRDFPLYYGAAQWAITHECARYILDFARKHQKFNAVMRHIKFPDEEYFHTIVHNSDYFRSRCLYGDEPVRRWLVNWRNLHYFEYPGEIVTFTEKDYDKLAGREELYVRKVRTGISDKLMNMLDEHAENTVEK